MNIAVTLHSPSVVQSGEDGRLAGANILLTKWLALGLLSAFMNAPKTKLPREELHCMVWTQPFVKLAREIGYSYPELVAICNAFNIPRPSGGYWYRKTHGGAEDPTPLTPVEPGQPTEISVGTRRDQLIAPPAGFEAGVESAESESTLKSPQAAESPAVTKKLKKAAGEASLAYEPIRVTRDELYQKVWKMTLKQMVTELGTTHVELVRACEEMNVPRPDQSYWSRLKLNLPVVVVSLPEPQAGLPTECLLRRKGAPKPNLQSADGAITSNPETESVPAPPQVQLPSKTEFTREQLYKAVWSKSGVKVAAELGISDVALAKTCRRMGIPRPPRGYWAKREAGKKPIRPALPAAKAGQSADITFHVAANVARREEWALTTPPTAMHGVKCKAVEFALEGGELHSIAKRHREALEKAKPRELGFVECRGNHLFHCEMSAALVPLFVRALDALLWELEDRDYEFKPGSGEYRGLRMCRDDDDATLHWSEAKMEVERQPTPEEKRRPSWTWQLKETKPTGELSIEIGALGLKGKRKWTAGEGRTLEQVLGVIVEKLEAVFRGYEAQRIREAEWKRQRAENEKREAEERVLEAKRKAEEEEKRKERERIKRHKGKLEEIGRERRTNLVRATRAWKSAQEVAAFVERCEARWRASGAELSKAQLEWLAWAKNEAAKLQPFEVGYPDPAFDGGFEAGTIPMGGPYPDCREWPEEDEEETKKVKVVEEPAQPPPQYNPWGYSPGWR